MNAQRVAGRRGSCSKLESMKRATVVLGLVAVAATTAAQQPTFKSNTGAVVSVFATVTDRDNRLVPDLTQDDFEVLDNDQPQPLVLFENETRPITAVVMLDTSYSMNTNIKLLKEAAEQFVIRLLPDDKAKVGAFNDKIEFGAHFTNNRDDLVGDLRGLDYGNATRLFDAAAMSLDELAGVEGRRVLVLLTDGEDTVEPHQLPRGDGPRAQRRRDDLLDRPVERVLRRRSRRALEAGRRAAPVRRRNRRRLFRVEEDHRARVDVHARGAGASQPVCVGVRRPSSR